tara:strand:- start:4040 stop:4540 length:501 start_codon:yes stop_codon:yes gene_type:complete
MALFNKQNAIGWTVQGTKELDRLFKDLPKQIKQPKIWTKFWRNVSKPLVKSAKSRAPSKTGQLKKSIGFYQGKKSKKSMGGFVGPRTQGAYRSMSRTGFYGPFQEFGDEILFWGKVRGESQKYMMPAWDATSSQMNKSMVAQAEKTMAQLIKSHEKRLNKYGKFGY